MGKYLKYIKAGLLVLLLVFVIVTLRNEQSSNAKIETVAAQTAKASDFADSAPAENRMIKRFYNLNPKDYEGAVLYAPGDNMDVHEMLIVKLKDTSQSQEVTDAIEERKESQIKSFEGYGPEQTALLKRAVLEERGNYILYVVGEDATKAQKAFVDSL